MWTLHISAGFRSDVCMNLAIHFLFAATAVVYLSTFELANRVMSFRIAQSFPKLKRLVHHSSAHASQHRWMTLATTKATLLRGTSRSVEVGENVMVKGGRSGIVSEFSKYGWCTVILDGVENETKRVRLSDISPLSLMPKLKEDVLCDLGAAKKVTKLAFKSNKHVEVVDLTAAAAETETSTIFQEVEAEVFKTPEKILKYDLPVIEAPLAHQACKSWVIFSDLHVKSGSIEVCEEVLDRVHQAALDRQAGIVFLGDFWHVRGSLSVDLLNRVLKALRKWTQPVIMIPGNHDQVTLGGKVHALEPLLYAFRPGQIIMINEPAVCLGALWVPYRRDPNVMRAVLRAGADTPGVSMIFCHADVKGAYMNDNMRSKEGLDIASFPKNIPIYSGHFHKPHTITKGGSTLRYLGSPYQTSLSEAGQDKFFYCVQRGHHDSPVPGDLDMRQTAGFNELTEGVSGKGKEQEETWKEVERWTVSIGSKIIKASSPADPSIASAQPGDRVVVTVPVGQDYAGQVVLAELQERGVQVDLQHEHNPLTRRRNATATASTTTTDVPFGEEIEVGGVTTGETSAVKVEDMNPLRIFDSFMNQLSSNTEMAAALLAKTASNVSTPLSNATVNEKLHAKVLEEGRITLDRLLGSAQADGSALGATDGTSSRVKELRLDKVILSNFGPYGGDKAVEYPLSSRGLVLIRGQSTDGTGADSNGAGKTTLAMSVMWGLTGSLDARIVGDSKSADVAYDAVLSRIGVPEQAVTGKKAAKSSAAAMEGKLTAEVVVKGAINNQPFEIIRRRSAKKAVLHFAVNGTILTTQAVKDTQALIDEHLGIKDGLLQRCCFFGQHTHTMQSLLGLTDVKLKQELSALVDTSLWVAAGQDVRARERSIKTRLSELAVEARLRREELSRADAAFTDANNTLNARQKDLELAQQRVSDIPVMNISISDLTEMLSALQCTQEIFIRDTLDPLKSAVTAAVQRRDADGAVLDKRINQLRLEVTKVKTEKNATLAATSALQKKRDQVQAEEDSLTKKIALFQANITAALSTITGSVSEVVDAAAVRQLYEQALVDLTSVGMRIDTANTSLVRLNELNNTKNPHACSQSAKVTSYSTSRVAPVAPLEATRSANNNDKDEECPTCGQEMPLESRANRTKELTASLEVLRREKEALSKRSLGLRKLYDNSTSLKTANDQKVALQDRIREMYVDISAHTATLTAKSEALASLEQDLKIVEGEKVTFLDDFDRQEGEHLQEQTAAAAHLASLQAKEVSLRKQIENSRLQQEQQNLLQRSVHAQLALAQDRVTNALSALQERSAAQVRIQELLAQNAVVSEDLTSQSLVLERLASVLGTRGIQNYVFQNVIEQLESITNAYLMVLAEGGIQLALQGDGEDEDRIVKSVWVRSKESDGEYRERSLAQLSGGQWRRVSLALDFAFAELIRRRGVLRSNLMVMDEVLTHLDASGRESVGTVLRAMVQGPGAFNTTTAAEGTAEGTEGADAGVDEFGVALPSAEERRMQRLTGALLGGGAYETVIVILQDLAAAELSEAFDHVDVVVKQTDSSRVVLDGDEFNL